MPDEMLTASRMPTLREREVIVRIGWFIRLRWGAGCGTLIVLFWAWRVFEIHFPVSPVLGTVFAIFAYNAVFAFVAHKYLSPPLPSFRVARMIAILQVVADLLSLTVLIHYLGGAENPFVLFYFFHMVIGSILLRPRYSYHLALLAALLVNGLIWAEYTGLLPHYHYESIMGACRLHSFNFNFSLAVVMSVSLFLSVYFASSISSQLRHREDELEDIYGDLQRGDEEKSYFIRKVSHELRSPMSAIQSFVRLLLEGLGGEISEEQRGILSRMQIRLDGLLNLVNDLLRLSQLRVLEIAQHIESFDFKEIVSQSVEVLSPWAEERGIELHLDCTPVTLSGNKEGLQEVATNLISNGIKYTPQGGRVAVVLRSRGRQAQFSVEDSGIGISDGDQKNLFREFFRAGNAKEMTELGTGLGLSIVKRVVEMHGGTVTFQSTLGKGTRFDISLPR